MNKLFEDLQTIQKYSKHEEFFNIVQVNDFRIVPVAAGDNLFVYWKKHSESNIKDNLIVSVDRRSSCYREGFSVEFKNQLEEFFDREAKRTKLRAEAELKALEVEILSKII